MSRMFGICTEVIRVGGLFPTALNFEKTTVLTNWETNVRTKFGAKVTASVTGTTLTQVLNLTNGGFITFLAAGAFNAQSTSKCRIIIDGQQVLDIDESNALGEIFSILGVFNDNTTAHVGTEARIEFNQTFEVLVAGDGVDPSVLAWKGGET